MQHNCSRLTIGRQKTAFFLDAVTFGFLARVGHEQENHNRCKSRDATRDDQDDILQCDSIYYPQNGT